MKQLLIYSLLLMGLFTACKKDNDRIFDESPDQRLKEKLAEYQEQLSGAPYGWKAFVYPAGGGAYSFYFKFNNANRVQMYSDFDPTSASTLEESSYRLKALQQPSLLFDTYSYLHVLADPDPAVNGGVRGTGLQSDFEFYFESATPDTIKLVGRFHGSKATLVKATQQEEAAFNSGELGNALQFNNISRYVTYFKRVTINGTEYEINVNPASRTITLSWLDNTGNIQSFTTNYYYDINGVQFQTPFAAGSQTVTGLTDITWDDNTGILGFDVNGTATTVQGSGAPLLVDVDAPRRWWQRAVNEDSYWVTFDGFHVDGVDDAYGITNISNFYFLLFWPRYGTSGGVNYDLAGFVTINNGSASISYGPAFTEPTFTDDGRIIFPYLGVLGTVPPTAVTPVVNTRNKFRDPAGFYLVQTGADSYDMVSADGRAWISWVW